MRSRPLPGAVLGVLLAALLVAVLAGSGAGAARARTTLARPVTAAAPPPMGFNDWNAYGCNVSAALIESAARFLHHSGMEADGYDDVNIDDCWLAPQRSATGELVPDPAKFPHGIAAVARYVHRLGLKLGIYEDAGTATCAGYPGSYGSYALDARTFAAWGVDYVKFDQCNIPFQDYPGMTHTQVDQMLYAQMSRALKATGRPIVFSACTGTDDTSEPWSWGRGVASLWRTTGDIQDDFPSTLANFEGNVGLWRYAGRGHFNDPDMLEIGNGGQTATEYRSQFNLWAEMAAPLISGTNLTALHGTDLAIYKNRAVIAVDQDPLGRQGRPVSDAGGLWVLTKRLSDGAHAVVLFNSTATPQTISTTARAIGAAHAPAYRLQNLWGGTVTRSGPAISAFVPGDGTVMYRVTSLRGRTLRRHAEPAMTLALSADPASPAPGATVGLAVSLHNGDHVAARGAMVTVHAPLGFAPARATVHVGRLARGATATRTLSFTVPATAAQPLAAPRFTAGASARSTAGGGTGHTTAAVPLSLVAPLSAPFTPANTTGEAASAGQLGADFTIRGAGTGISPAALTSHGTRAASDSYAAVDDPGAATAASTAQVTVAAQTGSRLRPSGTAGLIERPSLTTPGTPEGVTLAVSTAGQVTLSWNADGGTVVDSSIAASVPVALPVTLRLQRTGASVVGSYSSDGGVTWTGVGTATLAADASAGADDVGVFHSSGVAGWDTEAAFTAFSVS